MLLAPVVVEKVLQFKIFIIYEQKIIGGSFSSKRTDEFK
jgi:hypothetical protein